MSLLVPYTILEFNDEFEVIRKYPLEDLPGVVQWTRRHYNKFKRTEAATGRKPVQSLNEVSYLGNMRKFIYQGSAFLLTELSHPSGKFVNHFITLQGELIATYMTDLRFMDVHDGVVYFFQGRDLENGNPHAAIFGYRFVGNQQ